MPGMTWVGLLKRWRVRRSPDLADGLQQSLSDHFDLPPLAAQLLIARGIRDDAGAKSFLSPALTELYGPELLSGVPRAAERIARAVREKQPIVVYGDYDVDGITASAILWHILTLAGADVRVYIPHRVDEGYGLNEEAVKQLLESRPLIVTVDCGVTAVGPAEVIADAGVDLIITDHHELGHGPLPRAHTIVHPCVGDEHYPFDGLSGAGVAYKLAWQFARVHCGSDRLPAAFRALLVDLLSYAALGTIADVVPLRDENRVLVAHGLKRIKGTRLTGLNALIDASRLRAESIEAYHVGFVLAPRLNACGRMGHAEGALRLMITADPEEAATLAAGLARENDRRKAIEKRIVEEAMSMVKETGQDQPGSRAIVVGNDGWHPGVIGIVASRLVDMFHRPAVVMSYDGDRARGSVRGVAGVSVRDALEACGGLLESFGGHAMAAGLCMKVPDVDAFRARFVQQVNEHLGEGDLAGVLDIDAACELGELSYPVVEQLMRLAPFGRSNPHPLLMAERVRVDQPPTRVGAGGAHLRVVLRQGDTVMQAVGFKMGRFADRLRPGLSVDVAFEPKINRWGGRVRVEAHLKDLCLLTDQAPAVSTLYADGQHGASGAVAAGV